MRYLITVFSVIFLLLGSEALQAQPYPITATVQMTSNQMPSLDSYSVQSSNNIFCTLLLTDINEPSYDVFLRLTISGEGITIRTPFSYVPVPITLTYGMPLMLTSADLGAYFDVNNLEFFGMSQQDYLNQGQLPEGLYSICFEAYDLNRNLGDLPVSNRTCTIALNEEFDPPMITNPIGEQVPTDPQYLTFNWQPMHVGAFPVEYTLSIYEVTEGMSYDQVIAYTPPTLQTSTMSTTYQLGPTDPILDTSKEYITIVQVQEINGQVPFNNDGYSQLEAFFFSLSDFGVPEALEASEAQSNYFTATWTSVPCATSYYIDVATDAEFTNILPEYNNLAVQDTSFQVSNIDLGTNDYFYRIKAECPEDGLSDYSNVMEVSLGCKLELAPVVFDCAEDDSLNEIELENTALVSNLSVGDTIQAGDFMVILQEVSGSGPFYGDGYVFIPFFDDMAGTEDDPVRVNVKLQGIAVNEQCQMVDGHLKVTGLGAAIISEELAAQLESLAETLGEIEDGLEFVSEVLAEVSEVLSESGAVGGYFSDGWNLLDGVGAIEEEYPYLPDSLSTNLSEAIDCFLSGDLDACQDQLVEALTDIATALEELFNASYQVVFEESDSDIYGYDEKQHEAFEDNYNKIIIASEDYYVAWKAIKSGTTDVVNVVMGNGSEIPSEVTFETNEQIPVPAQDISATMKQLTLTGKTHNDISQIYAIENGTDSTDQATINIAGKLNLVSYDELPAKLVLVPVNGATYPYDQATLFEDLKTIYTQAVVDLDVSMHSGIIVDDFDGEMDSIPSGWLSKYNLEMDDIIHGFKDDNEIEDETSYLFLLDSHENETSLGYMPQGKRYGFIYKDNIANTLEGEALFIKTIAHEFGHGRFKLEHPFEIYSGFEESSSDNLMDYGLGTRLNHYQWDLIHNPPNNINLFDSDAEGASDFVTVNVGIFETLQYVDDEGYIAFLNNLGEKIVIKYEKLKSVVFATGGEEYERTGADSASLVPIGTLTYFTIKEGGQTIKYANCADGNYYPVDAITTDGCSSEAMTYTPDSSYSGNAEPVIARPCLDNGKYALHFRKIHNYETPSSIPNYDFLVEYFFFKSGGTYSFLGTLVQNDIPEKFFRLSPEFSDPVYKKLKENYSEYGEHDKLSSFYFNIFAYISSKFTDLYEECSPDLSFEEEKVEGIANTLDLINELNESTNELYTLEEQAISLGATSTADIQAMYKDMVGLLFTTNNSFSTTFSISNVPSIFELYFSRNKRIEAYQAQIDAITSADDINTTGLLEVFKEARYNLFSCEFDQLEFDFEKIKILIKRIAEDNWFWLDSDEEWLVLQLMDLIEVTDYPDFLTFLEDTPISTNTECLWSTLLNKIDDNFAIDENGKELLKKLSDIFTQTIQSPNNNIYKGRWETELSKLAALDEGGNEPYNLETLKAGTELVIPFHYTRFLNRMQVLIMYYSHSLYLYVPLPSIPITDVSVLDSCELEIFQNQKYAFFLHDTDNPNLKRIPLKPFAPVIVDKSSYFGITKDFIEAGDDNFRVYPACVFYYFNKNANFETSKDVIITTLDVVTIATPVGVIGGLHKAGKVLAYADKASSILSIAGTATQDNNPEISAILNGVSAVLGVADLTNQVARGIKNNKRFQDLFGHIRKDASDKPLAQTVAEVDDLSNVINTVSDNTIDNVLAVSQKEELGHFLYQQRSLDGVNVGQIDQALIRLGMQALIDLHQNLVAAGATSKLADRVLALGADSGQLGELLLDNGTDLMAVFNNSVNLAENKPWSLVEFWKALKNSDIEVPNSNTLYDEVFSNNWTAAQRMDLLQDVGSDVVLTQKFGENVGLIKAWEILISDEIIRTNTEDLEFMLYYLNKHPESTSEVANNFANATNKRSYLDAVIGYEAYGPFRNEIINDFSGQNINSTKICFGLSEVDGDGTALQIFAFKRFLNQDIKVLDIFGFKSANHISGELYGQGFVNSFNYLTPNVESIHFNLNGIVDYTGSSSTSILNRIKNNDVPEIPSDGEYTLWELDKLLKTELFSKSKFYYDNLPPMSGLDAKSYFEDMGISVY